MSSSYQLGNKLPTIHIVNALFSATQQALGQMKTLAKLHEIKAIQDFIVLLDVSCGLFPLPRWAVISRLLIPSECEDRTIDTVYSKVK